MSLKRTLINGRTRLHSKRGVCSCLQIVIEHRICTLIVFGIERSIYKGEGGVSRINVNRLQFLTITHVRRIADRIHQLAKVHIFEVCTIIPIIRIFYDFHIVTPNQCIDLRHNCRTERTGTATTIRPTHVHYNIMQSRATCKSTVVTKTVKIPAKAYFLKRCTILETIVFHTVDVQHFATCLIVGGIRNNNFGHRQIIVRLHNLTSFIAFGVGHGLIMQAVIYKSLTCIRCHHRAKHQRRDKEKNLSHNRKF